jgi:hypothetical protein
VIIWHIFPPFGILHQEKSGNPAFKADRYFPLNLQHVFLRAERPESTLFASENSSYALHFFAHTKKAWKDFRSLEGTQRQTRLGPYAEA